MAYAGQTIENPVSGEKITFIQTAADTDGELLEIELELSARRRRPRCSHPPRAGGALRGRRGHDGLPHGPEEDRRRPRRRRHRARRQDPRLQERAATRPPRSASRSARRSRWSSSSRRPSRSPRTAARHRKGMPKPLDLALFVRQYQREVKAPFPPAPIVRAMLAPLAWMATRKGHGERYAPAPELAPATA